MPDSERPVLLKAGEAAPFEAICLQKGTYLRVFQDCAAAVVETAR